MDEHAPLQQDLLNISVPSDHMTVQGMRNLIYLLYSKQYLINRATGQETLRIDEEVIRQIQATQPKSLEAFSEALLDFKAQGHVCGVGYDGENITLSFPLRPETEVTNAFMVLTEHIVRFAWVSKLLRPETNPPELTRPDSEKFYMNAWLMRLGLQGIKNAQARHVILDRLNGYVSFRNEEAAEKIRNINREIRKVRTDVFTEKH